MKKQKRLIACLIIVLILMAGVGIGGFVFYENQSDLVYKEVFVEAGSSNCDVAEFLKREESTASFTKDSKFDAMVPGDYELKIQWEMPVFGTQTAKTILHVQDTVAPKVTLAKESIEMYTTAAAPTLTDLVDTIDDVTDCTIDFASHYDFTKEGQFDITIVVTDAGGNETKCNVPCKVTEDVTPPEIKGVEPLVIAQGDAVSLKRI